MTDSSTPPADTDTDGSQTESEEGPVTTGTLFIMILFLMALAGLWVLMYRILLDR
jgi:hypothetical protein